MTEKRSGLTTGTVYRSDEAWAWARDTEQPDEIRINPAGVTALMVVHNAEDWLSRQLLALASLSPRPGWIVAIDNGSTDGSLEILQRARGEGVIQEIVTGSSEQGFGAAVAQGLSRRGTPEWLWLLHDDSTPKPNALSELLRCNAEQSADILVPKLLMPKRRNYPDQVLEVGRSISPSTRNVLSIEPGDIDQQQLDCVPTLGGSTAGMLISGVAWEVLGGFDPDIPLFRDGVDFGWRANELGLKVVTCPKSTLYHMQAGRIGWRESAMAPNPHVLDRLSGMRILLARSQKPKRTHWWLRIVGILRAIGFLLGKSPGQASDEIAALRILKNTPEVTTRMRERLVSSQPDQLQNTTALRPRRFDGLRYSFDRTAAVFAEHYRDLTNSESDTSIDELTGDDYAGGYLRKKQMLAPMLLLSLLLVVGGLVAGRGWLGIGSLAGGELLPAPDSLSQAWSIFTSPTPGVPGSNPLWLGFMALGSTLTFGQPNWFILVVLLFAPLFAAWSANSLLHLWLDDSWKRALIAGAWGVGVLSFGFVQAGSLTGIAFAIGLPMFVRAVVRWYRRPSEGPERWRGPASAAGWLILLSAAYPIAFALAIIAGAIWIWRDRQRWPEILLALLALLVFLGGWIPALLSYPGRWVTGVDPLSGVRTDPKFWLLIADPATGRIGHIIAALVFGSLAIGAAWLALTKLSVRAIGIISAIVGSCYLIAAGLSRLLVPVNGGVAGVEYRPWLLVAFGAVLAILVIAEEPSTETRPKWQLILVGVGALSALIVTAFFGTTDTVQRSMGELPGYVTSVQKSFRATRTLMVHIDKKSQARWSIVSAQQPIWGSAEHDPLTASPELAKGYQRMAQSIANGQVSDDIAYQLSNLGIGHVWVRGAGPEQIAAISDTADMTRAASDDQSQVWTVSGMPARAVIISQSGREPLVSSRFFSAEEDRQLVLAEPIDSRWQAEADGSRLAAVSDSQVQGFILPKKGGNVSWYMRPNITLLVMQVLAILFLMILAAPVIGAGTQARRGREG